MGIFVKLRGDFQKTGLRLRGAALDEEKVAVVGERPDTASRWTLIRAEARREATGGWEEPVAVGLDAS